MPALLLVALLAGTACSTPNEAGPSPIPSGSPSPSPIIACPPPAGPPLAAGTTVAYVAEASNNTVRAYAVNPSSGCLALLGTVSMPVTGRLTVDPTGQFLYVTGRELSAYRIDTVTGLLDLIERHASPATSSHALGAMAVSVRALFAIIQATKTGYDNDTWSYLINARTGAITSLGAFTNLSGPLFVKAEPSGQFVYVMGPATSAFPVIQTLRVNRSGAVLEVARTAVNPSSSSPGFLGTSAEIDRTGRCLWVTFAQQGGLILGFRIDEASGVPELVEIERSPADAGLNLGNVQLVADASGRFLFAGNSSQIQSYVVRRDPMGALEGTGRIPVSGLSTMPLRPGDLAVSPSGTFLYALGDSTGRIRAFSINGANGTLREIGDVAPGGSWLALVQLP